MITKPQVMPLLIEACPGFQPTWQAHLEWWKGEEPGAYNDTAEFARYLVESFESGQTSEFPAAFAAIEKILNEGDQESRDIAGYGVIESLQTIGSNHSCGEDVFIQWLGPTSRRAWAEIEKMWEGKSSLADVIRAEVRAKEKR
jgi:predicted transcriptional regulator